MFLVLRPAGRAASPSVVSQKEAASSMKWRAAFRELLSRDWRPATFALGALAFINNVTMFMLVSWTATFLVTAGWTIEQSQHGSAILQLGGYIGGLIIALLADRGKARPSFLLAYTAAVATFILFGVTQPDFTVWAVFLFVAGFAFLGCYYALVSLSATAYPPEIRSTGIAWVQACFRTGSVTGVLIGGLALELKITPDVILSGLAVPSLCALLIAMMLNKVQRPHPV